MAQTLIAKIDCSIYNLKDKYIVTCNRSFEDYLKERLSSEGLLNDPIVTVRLVNAKVTLLGEVKTPGTYNFTENNMSFLQALGLAGDLTINANRKDIIIIRNINNKQIAKNIDLTKSDWLNGPYASVKSNDVIIVNPNGSKIKSAGFFGNAGSFVSIASLLISTVSFIVKNIQQLLIQI